MLLPKICVVTKNIDSRPTNFYTKILPPFRTFREIFFLKVVSSTRISFRVKPLQLLPLQRSFLSQLYSNYEVLEQRNVSSNWITSEIRIARITDSSRAGNKDKR